jgi:hypothetical protein
VGNYAGGVAGTNMKVKVGRDLLAMESGWVNADWASIPSMNLLALPAHQHLPYTASPPVPAFLRSGTEPATI